MQGSASDVPTLHALNPKTKASSEPPSSYTTMPDSPIDMDTLLSGMATDERIKKVTELVEAVQTMAAKLKLGKKLNKVLDWMDEWGILKPLMQTESAINKFIEFVEGGAELTLNALWKLLGVEAKAEDDPSSVDAPVERISRTMMACVRNTLSLRWGQAAFGSCPPLPRGSKPPVGMKNQPLKSMVSTFSAKMPKLIFNDKGKIVSGEFYATIQAGQFGKLENVVLDVWQNARLPKIEQKFSNADFTPSPEHLPGVTAEPMSGKFSDAQCG